MGVSPGDKKPEVRKGPPPKARLYWSSLTATEKAVLDAMYEHCSDGSIVWASLDRLAAYAKLSRKTVQRVLHGDPRDLANRPGLVRKGIVSQLAKASARKRYPATYRINAAALPDDPSMDRFKKRQLTLPGIPLQAAPGESLALDDEQDLDPALEPCEFAAEKPVDRVRNEGGATDRGSIGLRTVGPGTTDRGSIGLRTVGPGTTDRGSTNSLDLDSVFDSLPDSLQNTQHADGALTIHSWLAIKEILRTQLSPEEWDLWVRPARFFRALDSKTMCIALPPNGRIQAAAQKGLKTLREVAGRAGFFAVLTTYPDEWHREQLSARYGIETGPKR